MKQRMSLEEYVNAIKTGEFYPLSAHKRMYHAILYAKKQNLLDHLIDQQTMTKLIHQYFLPASQGYDIKKRMLILVGPPGSGKSSIVRSLKLALEAYSKTDQGAIYRIQSCPMQEDPLLALPNNERSKLSFEIEGELSPLNRLRLEQEWNHDWRQIPVERIYMSEAKRTGIGSFFPSDPYSQDISDLIGTVDYAKITTYGTQADPRAYRYDGELQAANRGLLELQEVFKCDRRLLLPFLSLAEEKVYKVSRQALISADEVIIGHTNEEDLQNVIQSKNQQALLNRMVFIRTPYNLDLNREVSMYHQKILDKDKERLGYQTLETLAAAMILTRLKRSNQSITLLEKLECYQEEKRQREFLDEGMFGLDPRYAFQVLSIVCAEPLKSIEADDLIDELDQLINEDFRLIRPQIDQYRHAIQLARSKYQKQWMKQIRAILKDTQIHQLNQWVERYEKGTDSTLSNQVHHLLGIDETNIDHYQNMRNLLLKKEESISFSELPERYQDAFIDLFFLKHQDHLESWFITDVKPVLLKQNYVITERLKQRVLGIIQNYLETIML
ncbi:hypothetical protein [Tenuibacillus multivorans]|uniref:Serine protein kinase n=1 Tax=Tenuibacillus multivorans TaxID=237069 RepID=A0A1H0EUL9_9BACI|nr:hypothetical protein [Tenuibacillus multivorans]GEL76948.1 protein PrkA [Tenuibacillus multivorans]SDN86081.1 serine protein kinase [Tenuibacillus multivorans]